MMYRRYGIPILTGVAVLGAVTAFAAGFNVTSTTVLSGNADVPSCNNSAAVTYTTQYDSAIPGYKVGIAQVTTSTGCDGMTYRVSLTGMGNASLAELTGTLDGPGHRLARLRLASDRRCECARRRGHHRRAESLLSAGLRDRPLQPCLGRKSSRSSIRRSFKRASRRELL